jgi:sarcosine oxidase delta subunit
MNHKINCPFCAQRLEVEKNMLGQDAECPVCGRGFRVSKRFTFDAQKIKKRFLKKSSFLT